HKNSIDDMIYVCQEMNLLNNVENIDVFRRDLDNLFIKYYDAALMDISLGQLLIDIFALAYRHQVDVPNDITVLAKAILTAEEIIEQLDPEFSIMKAVVPFAIKVMEERYELTAILNRALQAYMGDLMKLRH